MRTLLGSCQIWQLQWKDNTIVRFCLVCLATGAGDIPIIPTISSVLLISNGHPPPTPGLNCTSYMLHSVNLCLCPILGVRVHQAEARICGCTIIVLLKFCECGAVLRLRISSFCKQKVTFLLGLNSLCLIESKRANDDRNETTPMVKWWVDCKRI